MLTKVGTSHLCQQYLASKKEEKKFQLHPEGGAEVKRPPPHEQGFPHDITYWSSLQDLQSDCPGDL